VAYCVRTQVFLDKLPVSNVTLSPGKGLTWTVHQPVFTVYGNISWLGRPLSLSGSSSFSVVVHGTTISLSATPVVTRERRMAIENVTCKCHLSGIQFRPTGATSRNLRNIQSAGAIALQFGLERKMCDAARATGVHYANRRLHAEQMVFPVGSQKKWLLDYRLVSVKVEPDYLEFFHKGEFFAEGNATEAPFRPSPLPSPALSQNRMITEWISDYVFNTAGYVLHRSGAMRYTMTKRDLPDDRRNFFSITSYPFGAKIDGSYIGMVIPMVENMCWGCEVEVEGKTTKPPTAIIDDGKFIVKFDGVLAFSARRRNGTLVDLFDLDVVQNVSLVPSVQQRALKFAVGKTDHRLTLGRSTIFGVPVEKLKFLFHIFKKRFIVPKLIQAAGVPLPLPTTANVRFTDPQVQLENNCIKISKNVKVVA